MSGADQWNGPESHRAFHDFKSRVPDHLRTAKRSDALQITCMVCKDGPFYVAEYGDRARRTLAQAVSLLRDKFAMLHMHGAAIPAAWLEDPNRDAMPGQESDYRVSPIQSIFPQEPDPAPEPGELRELRDSLPSHLHVTLRADAVQISCTTCLNLPFYAAEYGDRTRRTLPEALALVRRFATDHMHTVSDYYAFPERPYQAPPVPAKYEEPWLQSRDRDKLIQDGADKRAALAAAAQWAGRHDQFADVLELAGQCLDWLRYSDVPQRYVKGTDDETNT